MEYNGMQVFRNEELGEVRTVVIDGEPWFVAADVCRVLDIMNPSQAVGRLDDDEKARFNLGLSGGGTNCVNEYGLYALVLGSRRREARQFKRWIIHDVLPAIRKYGVYATSDVTANPETTAALLHSLRQEQKRSEQLEKKLNWARNPKRKEVQEEARLVKVDDEEMAERAARLFADTLGRLIEEDEVHLRNTADGWTDDDEDFIGLKDDIYLYTLPKKTYDRVVERCRAEGVHFPVSYNILNKCLRYMRLVEVDTHAGRSTKVRQVDGHSRRLLWLFRDRMGL